MDESLSELARVVHALQDRGAFDDTCTSIKSRRLRRDSSAVVHGQVAEGRLGVSSLIGSLVDIWNCRFQQFDSASFLLVLDAVASAFEQVERNSPKNEVVWTGPRVEGSFLRATRQVVQDIISSAQTDLLVVGYWIAAPGDKEGMINDVIQMIAGAAANGVRVRMVLDSGERPYGPNNYETLRALWPSEIEFPEVLTWRMEGNRSTLKLHAKVIVADENDGLITSANLTLHAMDLNMEMGVRITGSACGSICKHFDLLKETGILSTFEM